MFHCISCQTPIEDGFCTFCAEPLCDTCAARRNHVCVNVSRSARKLIADLQAADRY